MREVIIILMILLMLSGCSSELGYSGDEIENTVSNIPVVNQDHLIVLGDQISYSFGSVDYADTLVLTKEGNEVSQQRDITFTGIVPDSLILNLPKSFAETTDDIEISYRESSEEVPWRVIEKDPVIELIHLKQAQIRETISIEGVVRIISGDEYFSDLAYREARMHQFYKLLRAAEEVEDQNLFMLSVMTEYSDLFSSTLNCEYFEDKTYFTICDAIIREDNKPCNELKSENEFACRAFLYQTLKNNYKDITPEQHLTMIKFSGFRDGCEKLSGKYKIECEDHFGFGDDEEENENDESSDIIYEKEDAFDLEAKYDVGYLFVNPDKWCEEINFGYEIIKSLGGGPDLYCEYYDGDMGYASVSIKTSSTGATKLAQWQRFTNKENPDEFRKEWSVSNNGNKIQELYKNSIISVDGGKTMALNGMVDASKDVIDEIMPKHKK
ncbi:MAG: hypothetical protein U9R08_06450 [Nanoarchaeota archaeon]|nr:hypothetical protein [Nanoarchaeota archaeon]